MSLSHFSIIPAWLSKPSQLTNVINNPFSSLQDVPTFTHLQDSSHFSSGLRQALFWRKQLSPSASAHTVIFSFLGSNGLCLPNVLEVCQALKGVCNTLLISEIYRPANSNFIGISFSSPHEASRIRQHFTYFKDSVVIHVPSSSSVIHNFKLLWLPPLFSDARINHFLTKHSAFHQFTRDSTLTDTNILSPTNSVSGTLRLHPNTDVNLLPHLIPLPAPHLGHALFIVSGRPPYCLRCGLTGHVRRSCTVPRCSSCHRYHHSSSLCSLHAAPIDTALTDLWNDDITLNEADLLPTTLSASSLLTSTSDDTTICNTSSFTQSASTVSVSHSSLTSSPSNNNINSTFSAPKFDHTFAITLNDAPLSSTPSLRSSASQATDPPFANAEVTFPPLIPASTSLITTVPSPPVVTSQSDQTIMDCSSPTYSVSTLPHLEDSTSLTLTLVANSSSASKFMSHSSSSKRTRKRHKHHSSDSSTASSCSASFSDTVVLPPTSWADQVEEDSSLVTPPSTTEAFISYDHLSLPPSSSHGSSNTPQLITSVSPSSNSLDHAITPSTLPPAPKVDSSSNTSISSQSKRYVSRLFYLAAHSIKMRDTPLPSTAFLPTPDIDTSSLTISCPCLINLESAWPPEEPIACHRCLRPLTILHRKRLLPSPSALFAFLQLSYDDYTDPTCISYLLDCLHLKVPMIPLF